MKTALKFDMGEFRQALREYQEATKKDWVDILTRAGRNVAFKAITYTKGASLAKIRRWQPDRRGERGRMLYALLTKKGKSVKGAGIRAAAQKELNRRIASRKYIAAGWVEAAKDMGGKPRLRVSARSKAAKGYGVKATRLRLEAFLFNFVPGAEKMGKEGLDKAMAWVAVDMKRYAEKKMRQTARRYSGR